MGLHHLTHIEQTKLTARFIARNKKKLAMIVQRIDYEILEHKVKYENLVRSIKTKY